MSSRDPAESGRGRPRAPLSRIWEDWTCLIWMVVFSVIIIVILTINDYCTRRELENLFPVQRTPTQESSFVRYSYDLWR
ncbi:hypothetical protein Tter_2760 [Thermobaculum terrenum ATCC BAA-798]|uniref:Uncharacterized protein n=1 Tax=Thermobaculum terrenum (strain ATCC BAA-798 / CCMEE 7001 / YNP1) TaxID=525904 RepID=D1CIS6_THET1|nr:hypothetical protein [Thermobaculum terrenum]ACZ43646.1 hypothetical protein Tter_2760 [Thermobaculum terrenum ATCC BAA-798]